MKHIETNDSTEEVFASTDELSSNTIMKHIETNNCREEVFASTDEL